MSQIKLKLHDDWRRLHKFLVLHIAAVCSILTSVLDNGGDYLPKWAFYALIALLAVASLFKFEASDDGRTSDPTDNE